MHHVHCAVSSFDAALPAIPIRVDRQKLAKRLWRGVADDGAEFGFDVEKPLRHGDVVFAADRARYVIEQRPEPVLEIPLEGAPPDAAAVIGWAVGNMHFVVEAQPGFIRAPDDSALRQSLARLGIAFRQNSAVFEPHRFAGIVGHAHGHGDADQHLFVHKPRGP